MRVLNIDVETFSTEDIKAGVTRYSKAAELLLLAYSLDGKPVRVIDVAQGEQIPEEFIDALFDENVLKTAWNAAFEIEILERHFCAPMKLTQWSCTMVMAARCGYPLSLDKAAKAIGLPIEKDTAGKALIRLFSIPRKPTKTNPATRTYPQDNPEKWEAFKAYNIKDVEVEMAARKFFLQYPAQPQFEHIMYVLDRTINKRGLEIDVAFAQAAVQLDQEYKDRLTEEAKELTGLENPNSVTQLKAWFGERGLDVDSLNKESLKELLETAKKGYKETPITKPVQDGMGCGTGTHEIVGYITEDIPESDKVLKMLQLRKELSNTSVKKYVAMLNSVVGGRVYDTIQFNGAGRTGRNAGRIIQPQNMPRVYLEDSELDLARNIVKMGSLEALEMCFESVSGTLSQLIRTAISSKDGKHLKVVDLSAIEARVLAWLAGEEHVLEVFRTHGKIYEATAAMMFKVPFESIGKGSTMRQRGKVASLACIGFGELVLTDVGLVPIQEVQLHHKLWDGVEWVNHGGVIYKGVKEVIFYEGLRATEDHLVWVEGSDRPVPFGVAAKRGECLLQSGPDRGSVWECENNLRRKKIYEKVDKSIRFNRMSSLSQKRVDAIRKYETGKNQRVPILFYTPKNTPSSLQKINSGKTTVHKPKGSEFCKLRSSGNRVQVSNRLRSRSLCIKDFGPAEIENYVYRSNRQRFALSNRQPEICRSYKELWKQEDNSTCPLGSKRVAVCQNSSMPVSFCGAISGGNTEQSLRGGAIQEEKLEINKNKIRVFDILNSGPRNRFTVSGVLVHNCGYQGGANAITTMDLDKSIPDEEKPGLVKAWRDAHPNIVRYWYAAQNAAIKAIKNPGERVPLSKGAYFVVHKDALLFYLPSGRYLMYPKVGLEDGKFGEKIVFWGLDQITGQWKKQDTYSGKLVENLVQGVARDVLMEGMLNMARAGYELVTNVHDETVAETDINFGSIAEIKKLMCTMPAWADGLPLAAEGFESDYYKK